MYSTGGTCYHNILATRKESMIRFFQAEPLRHLKAWLVSLPRVRQRYFAYELANFSKRRASSPLKNLVLLMLLLSRVG